LAYSVADLEDTFETNAYLEALRGLSILLSVGENDYRSGVRKAKKASQRDATRDEADASRTRVEPLEGIVGERRGISFRFSV
jgi:hypothetical protein